MLGGWGLTQKWQPAGWRGDNLPGTSQEGTSLEKTKGKTTTTKQEQPSFWPSLLPRHFCFVPSQSPHRSSHRLALTGWAPWRCPLFHFILLKALPSELLVSALQMTSLTSGRLAWVAGWLGHTLEFMNAAPSRILQLFFLPWFLFIPRLNCCGLQAHRLPLWESRTCVLTEEIPTNHLNFGFALSSGGQPFCVSSKVRGVTQEEGEPFKKCITVGFCDVADRHWNARTFRRDQGLRGPLGSTKASEWFSDISQRMHFLPQPRT